MSIDKPVELFTFDPIKEVPPTQTVEASWQQLAKEIATISRAANFILNKISIVENSLNIEPPSNRKDVTREIELCADRMIIVAINRNASECFYYFTHLIDQINPILSEAKNLIRMSNEILGYYSGVMAFKESRVSGNTLLSHIIGCGHSCLE